MKRLLTLLLFSLLLPVCALAEGVYINEVMAQNGTYTNGHAYDYVEICNSTNKKIDLSGWMLTDDAKTKDKFVFPAGTSIAANGYVLVYCTGDAVDSIGKSGTYYASFALSSDGETVSLYNAAGDAQDALSFGAQYGNISYGRAEKSGEYGFLETATPKKANGNTVYSHRVQLPVLSNAGGFFDKSAEVFATAQEGATLRYTTDGSEPSVKSKTLSAPLTLTKTTVLRVRAFMDGFLPSDTVAATYFIDDFSAVPVVSLITDDKYLFDTKTGALVKGTGSVPNYDKELEYPVHIEYYAADGTQELSQTGTFTCAGHSARQNTQKSIALYARSAYGESTFSFNPFPNRDYTEYKSVLLRAANSDAWSTRLRDCFISSLAEGLDTLYQDGEAVIVYINGEYWGHYNIREKINKYFVAQYEGVTKKTDIDNIDILARTGSDSYVQNGSNADWLALMDFCKKNDLNEGDNLQYVLDRLDVDSLFDHTIFEMIIGNTDMTNVRVYRVPGGKWKYLLFDVEAGFMSYDEKPISYYIKSLTAKTAMFQHVHLTALLNVPEMREKFLARFGEILVSNFTWTTVEPKLNAWVSKVEPLLPRHIARWKNFTVKKFEMNISAVSNYARLRPIKVIDAICKAMKVTSAEREKYFGAAEQLLNQTNKK